MRYNTIVKQYYTSGIYNNCSAGLAIRSDGKRARIWYDGVKWDGNTGGYHRWVDYLSIDRARQVLRAYRCARATYNMGNGRGYSPLEVLQSQLTSNYNNAEPSIGIN
jgi:hypothetical protein